MVSLAKGAVAVLLTAPATPPAASNLTLSKNSVVACVEAKLRWLRDGEELALVPASLLPSLAGWSAELAGLSAVDRMSALYAASRWA
jgi:hypothetical protein